VAHREEYTVSVRIGRTLPPAVAPISALNIVNAIMAMFRGDLAIRVFTAQLKEYFNVKHCFLLSSGKASLTLILQALKALYPDRDEVLIPAFTCYSVPAAIVRAGLKVRICDVDPETLDFDYRELAEQLSAPRVVCVIPTHLFGVSADVPRVRELIGTRKITIVEDAAQSLGAEFKGRKVGTLGDVGLFSLGRGKAFSTVSGGVIVTNSDEIGAALASLCAAVPSCSVKEQIILALYAAALAVLSRPELFWIPKSIPFLGLGETHYDPGFAIKRLSAFQAGTSAGWQRRIADLKKTRQKNAEYYIKAGVKPAGGLGLLSSDLIRFPILVATAAGKLAVLGESVSLGLGGAEAYPTTVDGIAALQGHIVGGSSEKALMIVERLVTFPVHPYVTEGDMDTVVSLLQKLKEI
jgi:dTDP-4-amino-4,6-dideoxygalactose transaminase